MAAGQQVNRARIDLPCKIDQAHELRTRRLPARFIVRQRLAGHEHVRDRFDAIVAAAQYRLHGGERFVEQDRVEGSEEHTSELQSLMRISYAVFCLKKKIKN